MRVVIRRPSLSHSCALFLLAVLPAQALPAPTAVQWRANYDAARKEAAEKSKPIFLNFGTDDCVHCKRLHQTTFLDPAIVKLLNTHFIPLKIDANREPRLAQSLRIQAYPTTILAGHEGKIHGWIEGYMEASRLVEHLQRVAAAPTPDWMTRDCTEAGKLLAANEPGRALALLKNIVEDGRDRPVQAKALEMMRDIEERAAGRLEQAAQLAAKGQPLEAVERLTELQRLYAGTRAALESGKLLCTLAERPEVRRAQRAQDLLRVARDEAKMERYLNSLDFCEVLSTGYQDLPEARAAAELAASIKAHPQQMAAACAAMNDRLARMYLDLADTLTKKGEREQAVACLEKVQNLSPAVATAANVQARLSVLMLRTPGVPTGLQKP